MKNQIILIAACALSVSASAATMQVQVLDKEGVPVPDAVVVVYPAVPGGAAPQLLPANPTIEQEKMRFVPALTVVAPGTTVRFTNQDRWDHHLRGSAGGALQATTGETDGFELRLAGRTAAKAPSFADVKLDKPGVTLLSCHLHGSMRGHIFVSDSAWAIKTDAEGMARFPSVPEGGAQLRVWHAEQLVELPRKAVQLGAAPAAETISLNVVPRRVRALPAATGTYNR